MAFLSDIHEALSNLLLAKLRSFLAILGILVGSGSVVALMSSGQMATQHALAQFKTLGTHLFAVSIQSALSKPNQSASQSDIHSLHIEDIPKLQAASPHITLIAPYVNFYNTISYQGHFLEGQIIGTTQAFYPLAKLMLLNGRWVNRLDQHARFCDIGSSLAKALKQRGVFNPIGQTLQLGSTLYTIAGVIHPSVPNLFLLTNINSSVIIPLNQGYILNPKAKIHNIVFGIQKAGNLNEVQKQVKGKLQLLLPHHTFFFQSPQQIINIMSKQRQTFVDLLTAIGGIALLVGGIGVMNIMLVSVIERQREIGIRLAIGAKPLDILQMFLIESVLLTLLGGVWGVVLGMSMAFVIAKISGWTWSWLLWPALLGFSICALVGVLSGFYPALRASKLDPIEILQS